MTTDNIYESGRAYLHGLRVVRHQPQSAQEGQKTPQPKAPDSNSSMRQLSLVEFKLFVTWILYPLLGMAQRIRQVGISSSTANRYTNRALAEELICQHTLASSGRGRGKVIVEPQEKLLSLFHLSLSDYPGQGSFLHRYFQQAIKEHLCEQGHDPKIEYDLNGKRADIGYRSQNGESHGVEVELSDRGLLNLERDMRAGYKTITVLCATKKRFSALSQYQGGGIRILYLSDFLEPSMNRKNQ